MYIGKHKKKTFGGPDAVEVEMYKGKTDARFVQLNWSASRGLAMAAVAAGRPTTTRRI
jgi:hypothetical protein